MFCFIPSFASNRPLNGSIAHRHSASGAVTHVIQPRRRAQPCMQAEPSKKPYKIGLVLAGAATGGAYSAGVMDFFMEAMAAWEEEKAKENPHLLQTWSVKVSEIGGTSAGGITSTLLVSALNTGHQPLPSDFRATDEAPENNALFDAWVTKLDYKSILSLEDLKSQDVIGGGEQKKKVVRSFLNSKFLSKIAAEVLETHTKRLPNSIPLPEWASELSLCLTATNLNGIPYSAKRFISDFNPTKKASVSYAEKSENPVIQNEKTYMSKHADFTRFKVVAEQATADNTLEMMNDRIEKMLTGRLALMDETHSYVLNLNEQRNSKSRCWSAAIACAKATSAYPLFFPTVTLKTPRAFYDGLLPPAKPEWKNNLEMNVYAAVDGGVLDNRPFHLVKEHLIRPLMAPLYDRQIPGPIGTDSFRSIVLIDPFPTTDEGNGAGDDEEGLPILATAFALFDSVRSEAMFQEEEVKDMPTKDDKAYMEKFMIRPQRETQRNGVAGNSKTDGQSQENPKPLQLATGTINGFGGILHEKIRLHDFQLGRLNCKHFLEEVFVISKENALDNDIFRSHLQRRNPRDIPKYIPIIPVVDSIREKVHIKPRWPAFSTNNRCSILKDVKDAVNKRLTKISEIYFENLEIVQPGWWGPIVWKWRVLPRPLRMIKNRIAVSVREDIEKFVRTKIYDSLELAMDKYDIED